MAIYYSSITLEYICYLLLCQPYRFILNYYLLPDGFSIAGLPIMTNSGYMLEARDYHSCNLISKIDWEKFVSSEKCCIFAEKMEGYEKALYQ